MMIKIKESKSWYFYKLSRKSVIAFVTWSRADRYKRNDSASFVISDKCSWHNVSTWQHHLTWLLIKYLDIQVLFCNSWRTVQFIIYLKNIAHNMLLILLLLRMWRMWLNCMIKMISIHKIWDMSIQMFCKIINLINF